MKVNLVNTWQQKAPHGSAVSNKTYSTQRYCKLIGLNTSSYYAIKARQAIPAVIKPEQIALKASFMASGQTYGSRRLVQTMRHQGFTIGRYRVRRMMKSAQLVPVWKRKFVRTTDSRHTGRIAPNLLQQDFKVTRKNKVWVADITYIRTQSGWLYLAAVMDLYARKIVGWALASHMRASLVCSALNMAITADSQRHWKYAPKFIVEARRHFTRAIELDPAYAAAHAWLARTLLFQWIMKWDADDRLRELAYDHAQRAVELGGNLSYALSVLGWAHLWHKRREPAITACRKAVALDPNNAEAHLFLSMCLSSAGMGEEALYYIEKGRRLNPHSSAFYEFTLGQAYFVLEDYEKAIAAFKRGRELSETFPPNHAYLCTTYALLGREDEMRETAQALLASMGGDKSKMITPPWLDADLATAYNHLLELAGLR